MSDKDMINTIADNLLEDHVEIMMENEVLRHAIDLLRVSLRELLDEYHPAEHWTDAHIEYENEQGNMVAPIVRRAKDALRLALQIRGKEEQAAPRKEEKV